VFHSCDEIAIIWLLLLVSSLFFYRPIQTYVELYKIMNLVKLEFWKMN